jgi:hypothetical protein
MPPAHLDNDIRGRMLLHTCQNFERLFHIVLGTFRELKDCSRFVSAALLSPCHGPMSLRISD